MAYGFPSSYDTSKLLIGAAKVYITDYGAIPTTNDSLGLVLDAEFEISRDFVSLEAGLPKFPVYQAIVGENIVFRANLVEFTTETINNLLLGGGGTESAVSWTGIADLGNFELSDKAAIVVVEGPKVSMTLNLFKVILAADTSTLDFSGDDFTRIPLEMRVVPAATVWTNSGATTTAAASDVFGEDVALFTIELPS